MHDFRNVLIGEQLLQGIPGVEETVGVVVGDVSNQAAFVQLASAQEELVFLRFDPETVLPDQGLDLRDNGIGDGTGADIQLVRLVEGIDTHLAGQQVGQHPPHPGLVLRGCLGQIVVAVLQTVSVSGGEDHRLPVLVDFPDIIAHSPFADAQHIGQH